MKNVVIIGGGVAGLSAGIYCRSKGLNTYLFEKNAVCGGNLTGWRREGCYIDNCIHWLTGTLPGSSLYRIWRDIGMITDPGALYQASVFYESVLDGRSVAFSRYPELTRINMLKLSPSDSVEINRFIDAVEAVADFMEHRTVSRSLVSAYSHYRGITLDELGKRFKHPLLRIAFSDYILGIFSALTLVWAYGAFVSGNGMIPKGGSKYAAERIEKRFLDLGGKVSCSNAVQKIIIDRGHATGVLTENGEYIRADAVICACDPAITFGKLIPIDSMSRSYSKIYTNSSRAPRFSSVHAAFVCDSSVIPKFGTRVISWRPCGNGEADRLLIKEYGYESSFAPKGKVLLQTMSFQNENSCKSWLDLYNDKEGYETKKKGYAKAMTDAILMAFPTVSREELYCIDTWSPATYHDYFDSDHGAYMAFALTPKTPLRKYSGRLKGLDNVFLATQWQCAPGGLPNAARAGKAASEYASALLLK